MGLITTYQGHLTFNANADYSSSAIDAGEAQGGSFHFIWASLTGTINGVLKIQASNDGGSNWADISSASLTLSGASGNNIISLSTIITESHIRVNYTHNSVSGGSVNCYIILKG